MSKLKKYIIAFLSLLPLSAGAIVPWIIAGGVLTIAGFSIWRSASPVDMNDAYNFFSSCWTCEAFSSVMATMSNILPPIYSGIGKAIIPMAIMLTIVYFTWTVASGFLNSKIESGWNLTSQFGTHTIRLAIVCALLLFPLPRLITGVVIDPIFNIGLSVNHIIGDADEFSKCMVATTLADGNKEAASIANGETVRGAFPIKLRAGLSCELAAVHQVTGLGMTVGWTMLNMAFNSEYMHKIMWDIPIFPNIPIFFAGLLVLAIYFVAMLPIPLYFLEIFITLALDLIMLPLMLFSWLFKGWAIFPKGAKNIQGMINDVIKGTVGIAMMVVFLLFGMMFLDAIVGSIGGVSRIATAIEQNDSTILMDGLLMRDDGLLSVILMGIFFAMFMTSIPNLIKSLFNVQISDKYYAVAKKDFGIARKTLGKWWEKLKN